MIIARTASSSTQSLLRRTPVQLHHHSEEIITLGEPSRPRQCHRRFATSPRTLKAPQKGDKRARQMRKARDFAQSLKNAQSASGHLSPAEAEPSNSVDPRLIDMEGIDIGREKTMEEQMSSILEKPPYYPQQDDDEHFSEKQRQAMEDVYRSRYKKAYTAMSNSFVIGQLRMAARHKGAKSEPKAILIQNIMWSYGWRVPEAKKKKKVAEEVPKDREMRTIDLPANELFLFLRDTRFLEDVILNQGIGLSTANAGVSQATSGGNSVESRQVLQAEGSIAALDKLQNQLLLRSMHIKKAVFTEDDLAGAQLTSGVVQFISITTGAYIDMHNGQYEIHHMNERKVEHAARLLRNTAFKSHVLPKTRELALLLPSERYEPWANLGAILPFFASLSSVIPWYTLNASYAELVYRLSVAKGWGASHTDREREHQEEDVAERSTIIRRDSGSETENLSAFLQNLNDGLAGRKVFRATFGHLLFQNPPESKAGVMSTPFPGQWPVLDSLSRIGDTRPIFSPGMTLATIFESIAGRSEQPQHVGPSRRLLYRTKDGKSSATFTRTLPSVPKSKVSVETRTETDNWLDRLQRQVEEMESGARDESGMMREPPVESSAQRDVISDIESELAVDPNSDIGEEIPREAEVYKIKAERSEVHEVDIFLPDRPVDARLRVEHSTTSIEQASISEEINRFFRNLESQILSVGKVKALDAPDLITLDGTTFQLESDEEINATEYHIRAVDAGVGATEGESGVVLRNVVTRDMILGVDRVSSHTEIEQIGEKPSSGFWREWAVTTREKDPLAGSSRL